MTIETARSFLMWCTILNYAILVVWALVAIVGRGWVYRLSGRWFRVTQEQFDLLNIAGITLYKMGVFLFNLVPLIALYIVR
jgi:hypothetical protein